MGKGQATREAIVAAALARAGAVGLDALTLGDLAVRAGLSKSGLFSHFGSREALQLAVVEAAAARFEREVVAPALSRAKPKGRLRELFARRLDALAAADGAAALLATPAPRGEGEPGAVAAALEAQRMRLSAQVADLAREAGADAAGAAQFAFETEGAALAFLHLHPALGAKDAGDRAERALEQALKRL